MRHIAWTALSVAILSAGLAGAAVATGTASGQQVSVRLELPLTCGRLVGALSVDLPRGAHVPSSIAPGAVTINGTAVRSVVVRGQTVTATTPRPLGPTCLSIVEGPVRLRFAATAGLTGLSGRATVTVRHGSRSYRGTLTVG